MPPKRLITPSDIGSEVDFAESIWQHDSIHLEKLGWLLASYADCSGLAPAFHQQTQFQTGMFSLPLTGSEVHFNCGLARQDQTLWLVTRKWLWNPVNSWNSTIVAWRLDDSLMPTNPIELHFPNSQPMDQREDPRVFWDGNKFIVSYCLWRKGHNYRAHQLVSSFNKQWQHEGTTNIVYQGNGQYPCSGPWDEKNWVWFRHDGVLHFAYSMSPHTVVSIGDGRNITQYKNHPIPIKWRWGLGRGGTPPTKIMDSYWTFFHSSTAWKGRKKRYYMGAYSFEAKPPFQITRITKGPILRGTDKEIMVHDFPCVVFPNGALMENGEWLVTFGVNDQACAWIKIPHEKLLSLTEPV